LATGQRAEAVFLARTLTLLALGGVMVLIVSDTQIQPLWAMLHAHHLWVDQIWRVPDREYARFHQAVLVGHRETRAPSPGRTASRAT
jgi:hypothetical protein